MDWVDYKARRADSSGPRATDAPRGDRRAVPSQVPPRLATTNPRRRVAGLLSVDISPPASLTDGGP